MNIDFKLIAPLIIIFFCTSLLKGQFQDSILVDGKISTQVAYFDNPSGGYITFGTSDLVLNKYKLTSEGIEKVESEEFSSQTSMQDAIRTVHENEKVSYNDVYFYDGKFKGSGLGGYFSPYSFESTRRNVNISRDGAEWDLPLEKTKVDSYEKHLVTSFNYNNSTYSVLISGHKIKKDKTKKNNEHRDFEVFIYNGELLKKFSTNIKTEWGVIPGSAGVYTDEKGKHLGFYIEFDLGGGADGLSKMNKEATKNTKFIALLDERGKFIRTVEAEMPIKMGMLNQGEFYVNNLLLIDNKVHLYVVTREFKFGKGGDWIPGYFTFLEEGEGKMKYVGNPSYVDYQKNLTSVFSSSNRVEDMSIKTLLNNGSLSSLGTTNGKTFKYMNTKSNGDVEVFGTFEFSLPLSEDPSFRVNLTEVGEMWNCVSIYNRMSASSLNAPFTVSNDFIFVNNETGKTVPMQTGQDVVKNEKVVTKFGIVSFGVGKSNPNSIHIAYSLNYLED